MSSDFKLLFSQRELEELSELKKKDFHSAHWLASDELVGYSREALALELKEGWAVPEPVTINWSNAVIKIANRSQIEDHPTIHYSWSAVYALCEIEFCGDNETLLINLEDELPPIYAKVTNTSLGFLLWAPNPTSGSLNEEFDAIRASMDLRLALANARVLELKNKVDFLALEAATDLLDSAKNANDAVAHFAELIDKAE